ncbi:PAS protein, partial [Pseudomonas syringae pv. japonica str. M301072]
RLSAQEVETLIVELHKANLTGYTETLNKVSIGQSA